MKTLIVFFSIILFWSYRINVSMDFDRIRKALDRAPVLSINHFDFRTISESEDNLIDSLSFVSLYQVDSLLDKSKGYYLENPVYILGKKVINKNFDALITIRFYGEWFKTIDFLTYNKQGKLIGFLNLASYGGDVNYSFESSGFFNGNHYITSTNIEYLTDEFDNQKTICYKRDTKTLLNDRGEISLIENKQTKINCKK